MFGIEKKLAATAKNAGLLSGGLLLCAVGSGFLTVSVWFALSPVLGVATTALILAAGYFGMGLIVLGVAQSRKSPPAPPAQTSQPKTTPPLVEAFLYGLQAGAQADSARTPSKP